MMLNKKTKRISEKSRESLHSPFHKICLQMYELKRKQVTTENVSQRFLMN